LSEASWLSPGATELFWLGLLGGLSDGFCLDYLDGLSLGLLGGF